MSADVFFRPLPAGDGLTEPDLRPALAALAAALGLSASPAACGLPWALKVHLGPPHRPSAVDPAWTRTMAGLLAGGDRGQARPGTFAFDTLSITTPGLDEPGPHLVQARTKGFNDGADPLPYIVADGPDQGPSLAGLLPADSVLAGHTLAGGLNAAQGICVMSAVAPHPHVGLQGALTNLGIGLADRSGKIALHRDIRPQVDTPLCAGCGVCMTVCLFDAIRINAGRAYIDHTRCTGCGECMNVCFMAGIGAEEAAGIPAFQAKVADAAWSARQTVAAADPARQVYVNFLVRLDRQAAGARARKRGHLGDIGVLAGRDPVAVDQATLNLLEERLDGSLAHWSGFNQLPHSLLERAAAVGLGHRAHNLVTV